jgi:hypothetical protein
MPSSAFRTPSYRLHKPSGQAVVTPESRDLYLGRYGSPESRAEYDRIIAEWLSNDRRLPGSTFEARSDLTINEILVAYPHLADGYYTENGQMTRLPEDIRYAIRTLRKLYGHTLARTFGPLALKALRKSYIDSGLCRNEVNKRTGKVVRAFQWAVSGEMVPPLVHHGLKAVAGRRRGRADIPGSSGC